MADDKAKRLPAPTQLQAPSPDAPKPIPPKWPIYDALHQINAAFQTIAAQLERLDEHEAVPAGKLYLYHAQAEELRAAINFRITNVLHVREQNDWFHFGQVVRERQKD